MRFVVGLHEIKNLCQRPPIEVVFELRRPVLCIRRRVRGDPVLVIVGFPFALEAFAPPGPYPKLRLLQMDTLSPGFERSLNAEAKKLAVVLAGRHIIHIAPVRDSVAVLLRLRFVHMVDAIEPAIQVVLVLPPRNAGHHMHPVPLRLPRRDSRPDVGADPIAHRDIRAELNPRIPGSAGLKTRSFQGLFRISWPHYLFLHDG